MAFHANDIARLKAGIPDSFQPRDASGALSQRFRDLQTFNMGLAFVSGADDPETANPGFLLPGALLRAREARTEQKRKDEREKSDRFSMAQAKAALDRRIAALDAELAAIDRRLEEIRLRRAEIADKLDAMHDIEERRRSGKKFDGRDAADRRLLQAAGMSEEEANGDDYAAIIARRRADLSGEDDMLQTEWNAKMKRRGEVVIERAGAVAARGEIESASTEEARIMAERRAATVLGAQQLGEAASMTDYKDAKIVAADAVAGNERQDLRADSKAFNREAATDVSAVIRTDNASFSPG
ncbi:MAG: hypothetical protein WDN24_02265 [Sphingomonas sp.]